MNSTVLTLCWISDLWMLSVFHIAVRNFNLSSLRFAIMYFCTALLRSHHSISEKLGSGAFAAHWFLSFSVCWRFAGSLGMISPVAWVSLAFQGPDFKVLSQTSALKQTQIVTPPLPCLTVDEVLGWYAFFQSWGCPLWLYISTFLWSLKRTLFQKSYCFFRCKFLFLTH